MRFRLVASLLLLAASPDRVAAQVAPAGSPIAALPIADTAPLMAAIGDARFVALGEATHGTHEFYRERARISEQLIAERGFRAVVLEADAPDAERVNRYVRGLGTDRTAKEALGDFRRFPRWMWRNTDFAAFIDRLRVLNLARPFAERAGVYGMDVYNLREATAAVTSYLEAIDPATAARVRGHYACFARYRGDTQAYGKASRHRSCQAAAAAALSEVRQAPRPSDPVAAEARFAALRDAAAVAGAEEFFRTLYYGTSDWNVRDRRMAETVGEIAEHVGAGGGGPGKVIVWAHNVHVGDARATDAPNRGELNLGQLLRQRFGDAAFLLGFLTHRGTVMAAEAWEGPGFIHTLRSALPNSDAGVLHEAGPSEGLLLFRGAGPPDPRLAGAKLQRAVGVLYRPDSERQSHYFRAVLPRQFDAVMYLEQTHAVKPLDTLRGAPSGIGQGLAMPEFDLPF